VYKNLLTPMGFEPGLPTQVFSVITTTPLRMA
jgi:hypothetical protein